MSEELPISRKEVSSFSVVGISARTDNSREAGPGGAIAEIWHRLVQEGLDKEIPNPVGMELYGVYTDYASDHNGDYTFVAGRAVKPGTIPPQGMVSVTIPEGSYAVVTTEKGPLPTVIPGAWMKVFELEDSGNVSRAYKTDFELYDQRAMNPEDAQVDIYLGEK
jgi:predicted transcriptional regulator YdeE